MKKIFIIFFIASFALTVQVMAAELPDSGLTPDSPFYFLKSWKEGIQTFFTFNAEKKAEQYLHLAEIRLAEYQKMAEKGRGALAEKTLTKYQNQLNRALSKAEELKNKGEDVKNLTQQIQETVSKHLEILKENLQKAPEQAKSGIENAIENSQKQIEKILEKPGANACTQEAKICPDGSSVGRTGPNCEFAACLGVKDETVDWKIYRNEKYGFEVKYPKECSIKIINEPQPFYPPTTKIERKELIEIADCNTLIEIYTNPNNLTLANWNTLYQSLSVTGAGLSSLGVITINPENKMSGYKGLFGCCDSYQKTFATTKENFVYILKSRKSFSHYENQKEIDFWLTQEMEKVVGNATFNNILFTFNFIGQEKQLGLIKSVYEKNGKKYLDIDYIQSYSGDPVEIINENPKIRTFEISPNVIILRIINPEPQNITYKNRTYNELENLFVASNSQNYVYKERIPFEIEIINNIITKITEQYVP